MLHDLSQTSFSAGPPALAGGPEVALSRKQKAAVIVRLLVAQGEQVPLAALSEDHQADLTHAIATMRAVSRSTLRAVVEEFLAELDSVGLSFPGGIDAALDALDGHLGPATVSRLRRRAMAEGAGDPWSRIAGLGTDALLGALGTESIEVGAVLLSKLSVARSAELLSKLPGERARRLAHAIAEVGRITPANVRRIGLALLDTLDSAPEQAFETTPVERVGAILNYSPAATRDDVLEGLEQEDAAFAAEAAFTTALAAATAAGGPMQEVAEFLLGAMSQRMAAQLRDEIADRGAVKDKDGEAAMGKVVAAIRELEQRGELVLVAAED